MRNLVRGLSIVLLGTGLACTQPAGDSSAIGTSLQPMAPAPQNPYAITSEAELLTGPQAEGRFGDIRLANDVVQFVIQQGGRYPGVGSFGGHIIDASWIDGRGSQDQFGVMLPLVNIEWSLNAIDFLAFAEFDLEKYLAGEQQPLTARDADVKTPVLVVRSLIDTYEFLDIDFLEPLAKALTNQTIGYDAQFDDMNAPFRGPALQGLRPEVFTEYRLPDGATSLEIATTLFNDGDEPVQLPVGDFVNGSGALQMLIPGLGYAPPLQAQIAGETPAVIYAGQEGVDISYGYFFRLEDFVSEGKRLPTTSLTYSGVTGVLLGEQFTKVFPIGGAQRAKLQFTIPPHGSRRITRYLVVGDGSAASVFDTGLKLLGVPRQSINGQVIDAEGNAVARATVAVLDKTTERTIVTYRTDGAGRFSGYLSDGSDEIARAFGSGEYLLRVDKAGYREHGSTRAGTCTPGSADVRGAAAINIQCVLGSSGVVQFTGPMVDLVTGTPLPVRVTVLGMDPSPDRTRPGVFTDPVANDPPYGVVAMHYLNANGNLDAGDATSFRLEPGAYQFVYSRGPEYALRSEAVTVRGSGVTTLMPGSLARVVATPGWVSADFHVHASPSPDSGVAVEQRVIAAAGEGLDVLHSSDHDYLFDYGPVVSDLESRGVLVPGQLGTIVGDEISPNHLGHIHAFPLARDETAVAGGALNWSLSTHDQEGPDPDFAMSIPEIVTALRASVDHEIVVQMNHISDRVTSLLSISGLVTSPLYEKADGVRALASYSDPRMARLPFEDTVELPLPWGTSPHTSGDFTAIELSIGSELSSNHLLESGLPQWFNLLNLGLRFTATADSDSHTKFLPIGLPRNYIRSELDPADGLGSTLDGLAEAEYTRAINEHRVVISAGPIIELSATSAEGQYGGVGDLVSGRKVTVRVEVTAPSWAWFDTIELYANTEPTPVDDDGFSLMKGAAAHAESFYQPYHLPHYSYQPLASFRLADGTLTEWTEAEGVIHAVVEYAVEWKHDTWLVAMARGTAGTEGFRPLFPVATRGMAEDGVQPEITAEFTLEDFYADPTVAIPAWALTNPIFFDVDGDTNHDGDPFEALWVKRGWSPL